LPCSDLDDAPGKAVEPPREDRDPDANTECALLYTSGTTGRPKGCVLPNEYFLEAGRWYAETGGLIALREGCERMLTPLPIFHMNAMAYSGMAMLRTGGCLVALDRFHPRTWWDSVRAADATIVHYLGVMPPLLMSAEEGLEDRANAVRFGFGAGVDRSLHGAFEARFGFPLVEAWAMTETGAGAVICASHEPRHVGTSCFGRPMPEIETRIVREDGQATDTDEPGELLVRRAGSEPAFGFFRHYLKDPRRRRRLGRGLVPHRRRGPRGLDGSLHFVDRKKNVIRRSGENISAVEVESVLMKHPDVRAVAIAPTPDRSEETRSPPASSHAMPWTSGTARLATELVAWCLERLAYYKAPGYVAFVERSRHLDPEDQRGELKALVPTSSAGPPASIPGVEEAPRLSRRPRLVASARALAGSSRARSSIRTAVSWTSTRARSSAP
jgi:acyl-coenzyme A synthetase/AMP-(fatty) acid ligase